MTFTCYHQNHRRPFPDYISPVSSKTTKKFSDKFEISTHPTILLFSSRVYSITVQHHNTRISLLSAFKTEPFFKCLAGLRIGMDSAEEEGAIVGKS